MDPAWFQGLRWRCIGPPRGGRVVAVAGHPTEPMVFYFGGVAGGVWKTTDGGTYWENVSDGHFRTSAIGALAVSESDPNVVYAGTGEATIRIDVVYGDGVYKSTDGGKTWTHIGLTDTQVIARIRVHPTNPDLVYVAAFGHHAAPNPDRGVYRSKDGGKTWAKILFRDDKTGGNELVIDPKNPQVIYAALWEAYRNAYEMSSGGPGSGIFKTTDGGDHWTEISRNPGLPKAMLGKIGFSVSGADSNRLYAQIEAEDGGFFLSDDAGATFALRRRKATSTSPDLAPNLRRQVGRRLAGRRRRISSDRASRRSGRTGSSQSLLATGCSLGGARRAPMACPP
jgi:photosystem II stability/assembly factor-like uncharacterized protein